MLPQTNLQLYRLLIARDASEVDLARVRAAYDLATRLFASSVRPSHKPFVCHLVGVAGALATWNQSSHVVAAGLLHSAYLFGDFGDGERGAAPRRRRIVCDAVGPEAEAIVERYTRSSWNLPIERVAAQLDDPGFDRECLLLKLADVCDECVDAGARFSPQKQVEFGVVAHREARDEVARIVGTLAGPAAASNFSAVLSSLDTLPPPAVLVTTDKSYHVVERDPSRRTRIGLQFMRLTQAFGRKRAA